MLRYPLPFRKDQILILGMHCSGTTLPAEILKTFQVHLGRQLEPHLEAEFFTELMDALLAEPEQCRERGDTLASRYLCTVEAPRARRFEEQPTKDLQQNVDESLIMQHFGHYA